MKRYAVLVVCLLLSATSPASDDDVQAGIFQTYLKLAEQGDMNAQYIVAHRYEIGKGTGADIDKANYWYDRAAAKGHPLALRKVEERRPPVEIAETGSGSGTAPSPIIKVADPVPPPKPPAAAPAARASKVAAKHEPAKPRAQPASVARQEKPHGAAPAPAHVAAESRAKEGHVVAKAVTEQVPPAPVDMIAAVLRGQWSRNRQPAEFLPSARAACLQSSRAEIVCFSSELTRNVGSVGVTYNVKTVLSGLDNRDGRFALSYVYNVLHVASRPEPEALVPDTGDLQARTGWQEPGHTLDCRFNDERSMTCARADRKLSYQFARD